MLILVHVRKIPCKVNVQLSPPPPNWNDNVLLPPPLLSRLFSFNFSFCPFSQPFLVPITLNKYLLKASFKTRKRKSDIPDARDSTSLSPSDPLPFPCASIPTPNPSTSNLNEKSLSYAHPPRCSFSCTYPAFYTRLFNLI